MTLYGDLFDFNLTQSLLRYVRSSTALESTDTVIGEDHNFDPQEHTLWAQIAWVYFGPRATTQNTLHVRIFSRSDGDRYGRTRELFIGRVKHALVASGGIPVYDYANDSTGSTPVLYNGDPLLMALRFGDRGPVMDGDTILEHGGNIRGIKLVVLTYNVYVARPHETH